MATTHVDDTALSAFIHDPQGGIYKDLRQRGRRVARRARQLVGVESGSLRASIGVETAYGRKFPEVRVAANHRRAMMHHDGTPPHLITPERGRVLKFKVAGKIVYAEKVDHPGTRANPFLYRALREAAH